ncbi:hypothetical protein KIV56_13055 [Cryobacterium breve]|uniref:Uncharacterized protein n=1 Tax=Cryobacterium breve TaxID=1259258 RepID=A0ABY7NFP1_9MICO|nr:hypothetical protein [Cryobacterium breve]WBM79333.1 hypothetical protein KIV56_13055 [Cryobacterium breve]
MTRRTVPCQPRRAGPATIAGREAHEVGEVGTVFRGDQGRVRCRDEQCGGGGDRRGPELSYRAGRDFVLVLVGVEIAVFEDDVLEESGWRSWRPAGPCGHGFGGLRWRISVGTGIRFGIVIDVVIDVDSGGACSVGCIGCIGFGPAFRCRLGIGLVDGRLRPGVEGVTQGCELGQFLEGIDRFHRFGQGRRGVVVAGVGHGPLG